MSDSATGKTYSLDVCSPCKLICCQDANPPLTVKRKKIIREYLKQQKISVKDVFVHQGHSYPASDKDGFCIFYSKGTHKCIIHPVKPETCKAGPITFDINLRSKKVEFYLKKGEICALAQIIYDNSEQFKNHFEVAKAEILRLICELKSADLKDLLTIEEPQTFKVSEANLPNEVAKKLGIS
jgi:uncharacterized protein